MIDMLEISISVQVRRRFLLHMSQRMHCLPQNPEGLWPFRPCVSNALCVP